MTNTLGVRMQRFYERLNVDRERALEELPDLYTDDIAFFCPMETRYGLATFKRSWEFAFASYKMFEFHDFTLVAAQFWIGRSDWGKSSNEDTSHVHDRGSLPWVRVLVP